MPSREILKAIKVTEKKYIANYKTMTAFCLDNCGKLNCKKKWNYGYQTFADTSIVNPSIYEHIHNVMTT